MTVRIMDELDAEAAVDAARAGVRAGRLLRAGDVPRASRDALRAWCRANVAIVVPTEKLATDGIAIVEALLSRFDGDAAGIGVDEIVIGLETRDDAESCAVALGFASLAGVDDATSAEARLVAALRALDASAEMHEHAIATALRALAPARARIEHLARMARLDATPWWLDAIAAHLVDARAVLARLPSPSARLGPPVLRVRRDALARPAAMMMSGGEPGRLDTVLERPLGEPVVTLFDDEVELFAFGLAASDDAPPGLLVRQRDGEIDRIESVALEPPGPAAPLRSRVDLAWWVPLSGTADGRRALVVRYRRIAVAGAARPDEAKVELEPVE